VVLAALTVSGNIGMAEALARRQPAIASVVLQTQIVIVAAVGRLWLKERISTRFVVGAVPGGPTGVPTLRAFP
jgi:drug/metabolite transporter (DMT)-like permease